MFIFESESKRNATELLINDAVPLLTEKNLEKIKVNDAPKWWPIWKFGANKSFCANPIFSQKLFGWYFNSVKK